jgi:hypothetical protein
MQKLFFSITLLFSGAFSFTTNDPLLNSKSIPSFCVGHYLINMFKEPCPIISDEAGNKYVQCPPILLEKLIEQYYSCLLNTDDKIENEKDIANTTDAVDKLQVSTETTE